MSNAMSLPERTIPMKAQTKVIRIDGRTYIETVKK